MALNGGAVDLKAHDEPRRVTFDRASEYHPVERDELGLVAGEDAEVEGLVRPAASAAETRAEDGFRRRQRRLDPDDAPAMPPSEGRRQLDSLGGLRGGRHLTLSSTPSTGSRCAYSKCARPSESSSSFLRQGSLRPSRPKAPPVLSETSLL